MDLQAELQMFYPILISMGLGAVLGIERELAGKAAGLRTNMLVAAAATLLVLLGDIIISRFASVEESVRIVSDPVRIFEAIIVGVAFIGTGTIQVAGRPRDLRSYRCSHSLPADTSSVRGVTPEANGDIQYHAFGLHGCFFANERSL